MENAYFILESDGIGIIPYIIKLFFICMCTYYTYLRIINNKLFINKKFIIVALFTLVISIVCGIIKYLADSISSMLLIIFTLSILYSIINKNKFGYSILITIISLSINYIIFFISIVLNFAPALIFNIQNYYISLFLMILFHFMILYFLFKIKRFKDGFLFLQKNLSNEYFDILILNISIIILFSFIILNNFNLLFTINLSFGFVIFAVITFITIRKSLSLYYKHKLLVDNLNNANEIIIKKDTEIEKLEKEIFKFNKDRHSIAHKQNSLEFKLNELIMKSEISSEIDISDKVKNISNECFSNIAIVELSKTHVENIDDMLSYFQAECVNNNIEFEFNLNSDIYSMVNNYVSKEDLEILIADLCKNSIVAINNSNNINRSIFVRLGMIDGFYSLYVYDSGIEFEITTLENLGIKPVTTHSDIGGTGYGFINTFETLNKYNASIYINELNPPCIDNYTKVIMIKFDKKSCFEIHTYREDKFNKSNISNNLSIYKL